MLLSRPAVALSIALSLIAPALAHAQSVTVRTLANGASSTTIPQGQLVSIQVVIDHPFYCVAGIQGGTIITGNAGLGQNFASTIPPLPTMNFGTFLGGSRVGADIATTNGGPLGPPPEPFTLNPMLVWTYDIAGLAPGSYEINWLSPSTAPSVRGYMSGASAAFVEAQTTYSGAIITIVPSPPTAAPLLLPALAPRRRRGL